MEGTRATTGAPLAQAELSPAEDAYLELLRRCLTRDVIEEPFAPANVRPASVKGFLLNSAQKALAKKGLTIVRHDETTEEDRIEGRGWPASAETMMGLRRLEFFQSCLVDIIKNNVPGDLFEAGCWRGGGVIFMLGALRALGDTSRRVWAADSFSGYPAPTAQSHEVDHHLYRRSDYFSVTREQFEANVRRYGLFGPRLQILQGWFGESIPAAPIENLSLIRIDVDGYEGVRDTLKLLYPRLSHSGYVLIDDIRQPGAKRAVDEFVAESSVSEEILQIPQADPRAVYWRKTR
jgi:O-methyltransferase